MTLDCDRYRMNFNKIKILTLDKTPVQRMKMIGILAACLGVPVIVICCYLGELYGFTKEIDDYILFLKDFYSIAYVINIKKDDM